MVAASPYMINQLHLPALVNGRPPAPFGSCLHSSTASSARFTGAHHADHTPGIMASFASSSAAHVDSRRRDLSVARPPTFHRPPTLKRESGSGAAAGRGCCRAGLSSSGQGASPLVPPEQLMAVAKQAAEAGAKIVMDAVDKPRSITYKGATDLVTETDKASEEAILQVLRKAFPDHALLGEEGGVSGNTDSPYLWCVDPLDGTTNFAHAYPAFAVSVGVALRGEPVAGCVVEFTGGPGMWGTRTFTGYEGGPALMNGKPTHVSKVSEIRRSLLVTGFGYEHDDPWLANMHLFKDLTDEAQGVRRLGAAAVDLCHLSMGVVEAYWEYRLKPWDTCAGIAVARSAGARVTTMDGRPYSVFSRSMLATNGLVHDDLEGRFTGPRTRELLQKGIDLSPWFIPKGYQLDPKFTS